MCIIMSLLEHHTLEKSYFEKNFRDWHFQNNTIITIEIFFCNLSLVTKLNIIERNLLRIFCNRKRKEAKNYYTQTKKNSFFKEEFKTL